MAFKELESGEWKPTQEGETLTGIYLGSKKEVGPNKVMMYHLESEGKPISVWGSAILDDRMAFVKSGQLIRITYKGLGEAKSGQNAPKIFKVEVDDGEE